MAKLVSRIGGPRRRTSYKVETAIILPSIFDVFLEQFRLQLAYPSADPELGDVVVSPTGEEKAVSRRVAFTVHLRVLTAVRSGTGVTRQ